MILALSAKNKLGFVNGTIAKPELTSLEYVAWERCNNLVISWLLFNLDETIARSVLFLDTASAIWKDLEDIFGFTSVTQVYSLEQKLTEINQGTQSISEFYTQIKSIWDNLDEVNPSAYCNYGQYTCQVNSKLIQKVQEQRLLQFLMKLNDHFSTVRGHILLMQPLPSVSQAFRLIVQEETHKEFSNSSQNDAMAFSACKRTPGSGNTVNYNGTGSRPQANFSGGNANRKKPGANYYCTNCKISGHSIERCFKIHEFPPGFKQNRNKKIAVAAVSQSNHENSIYSTKFPQANVSSNSISVDQYN
ncbi:hypothetical protein AgCh_032790 [Apium graveolens]